ncbi:MAG: AbrB/MazE/SpoVT family DNA-binding domain-containing protein [Acetobacteraceae bacterium]
MTYRVYWENPARAMKRFAAAPQIGRAEAIERDFIASAGVRTGVSGRVVASLTITAKGRVTLKRDLLQHLGIRPGERAEFEKLPGGELRVRAAWPGGNDR